MTEFINMWKNYINFKDRTNVRGYWMAFLFYFIASLVIGFIAGLIGFDWLVNLYGLAVFLPFAGLNVRRLRDMGKQWYWVLLWLIPIIGWIIIILQLVKPSIPDDGVPVV